LLIIFILEGQSS